MALPPFFQHRMSDIGRRIIQVESECPSVVRLIPNQLRIPAATMMLKDMGFHKRLLESPPQFVYDCFLRYQQAVESLLPYTLLTTGPGPGDGRYQCWTGCGQYGGWQALLRINGFGSGGKDKCVLIVNITPFFDKMTDLLDLIKEPT